MTLPPLPAPHATSFYANPLFTADQMRAYAERYLVLVAYLTRHQLLRAEFCQPEAGMKAGDYWVLRSPAIIDGSSCLGYGKSEDAAIDAAMKAPI